MALPALERLRERYPESHITLVMASKLEGLFLGLPSINETISFQSKTGTLSLAKRLKAGRFNLAIIFPNSFRSAIESWLAGIPLRVGYGGNLRGFLLSRVVARRAEEMRMHKRSNAEVYRLATACPTRPRDTFPSSAHHLHHYLHLAAALGANPAPVAPRISISESERAS